MAAKYFALLTHLGAAKLANATALGTQLEITQMAVGDGGGALPIPDPAQVALKGEKRRAAINLLTVDPLNTNQIINEQVIPENEGGWWIREIGLFDKDGALIAIANCPETYKPLLQEGSGRTQTIRVILIVSSTESVSLKVDPSVVLATRKYVDDAVIEVRQYADKLLADHVKAADPHTQYAPKKSPTFTGTPKAPTPAPADNSTLIATTEFVKALVAAYAPLANPNLTGKPTAPTPVQTDNSTQIATTAFVKALVAAYAPLANPALTGKPTAPTPVQTDNSTQIATTAFVKALVTAYAPLANPVLTGKPTAPTAAQTVNDTQIATTAFVRAAINGLISAAPGALDTLKELADALGNDPNFATTITKALAGKQPLNATLTNLSGKDVAGLHTYLGLKEAAKRAVGTGSGQIPDIGFFGSNLGSGYKRIADASSPTGYVIWQWGDIAPSASDVTTRFPVPYPNRCLRVFATQAYTPGSGAIGYIACAGYTSSKTEFVSRSSSSGLGASFFSMGY